MIGVHLLFSVRCVSQELNHFTGITTVVCITDGRRVATDRGPAADLYIPMIPAAVITCATDSWNRRHRDVTQHQ